MEEGKEILKVGRKHQTECSTWCEVVTCHLFKNRNKNPDLIHRSPWTIQVHDTGKVPVTFSHMKYRTVASCINGFFFNSNNLLKFFPYIRNVCCLLLLNIFLFLKNFIHIYTYFNISGG